MILNSFRKYPLFSIVFVVMSIAALLPIWGVDFLPLLDWPQHLGVVAFLRHSGDPTWGFDQYVVADPKIATYLTFYYLSTLLAYLMPVSAACKAVLSLYIVGTPLAAVYLLRSFTRSPWPALLTFVVLYNWSFYMGFAAFVLSFPLILLGVGLIQRQNQRVTRRRWWALLTLCVVLFFTHSLSFLILGAIALPLVIVGNWRRPWDLFMACAAWVPSLVFFSLWAVSLFGAQPDNHLMGSMKLEKGKGGGFLRAQYRPLKEKIEQIKVNFNEGFRGDADLEVYNSWTEWLLILIIAGLLVYLGRRFYVSRAIRTRISWFTPLLVTGIAFGLYFAMPMQMLGVWALSPRLVALAALFAILLVPPLFRRDWPNLLLFIPIIAFGLSTANLNRKKFTEFQAETRGLPELLSKLEYGKRAYGLMYNMGSKVMTQPVFMHFGAYYMVERGGMVGFSHFHYNIMPARYKNIAWAPYPGQSGEWRPRRWKYPFYGLFYDYLVVRGFGVRWSTRAPRGALKLLGRTRMWAVYHNPEAGKRYPLFSFREKIHRAEVSLVQGRKEASCGSFKKGRFQCPHAGWTWVGPEQTKVGRVHLPCIWAHPVNGRSVRIRFKNLPAGDSIAGILGVADSGFPGGRPFGAPVELTISVDGQPLKTFKTPTRPGYKNFDLKLPKKSGTHAVSFDIRAKNDARRHFCFTATLFRSR